MSSTCNDGDSNPWTEDLLSYIIKLHVHAHFGRSCLTEHMHEHMIRVHHLMVQFGFGQYHTLTCSCCRPDYTYCMYMCDCSPDIVL